MQLKRDTALSPIPGETTTNAQWHAFALPWSRPVEILHVEDNPADIFLLKRVLSTHNDDQIHLTVATDGEAALALLRHASKSMTDPLPDLILLDANLPKVDGWTVLSTLKADSQLCHIPVIMLSSSESERDIRKAYMLGVSCYVVKALEYDVFRHTIQTMIEFWLKCVRLPSR